MVGTISKWEILLSTYYFSTYIGRDGMYYVSTYVSRDGFFHGKFVSVDFFWLFDFLN